MSDQGIDEAERRPLIDEAGRRLLTGLLEHDAAPRYNHVCGDRIDAPKLAALRAFDHEVRTTPPFIPGEPPDWVPAFTRYCIEQAPCYRSVGTIPARFEDLPTWDRNDLIAGAEAFVPDDHPLDDLALYATTGTTTGEEALIPSTPVAAAAYGSLLRAAMAVHGLDLVGGPGRVAVAQICWQRSTFTYASISSFFDQAGLLKLNLNPADWRRPGDPVTFLDAIEAEIYTGDPVAFAHLLDLATEHRPKALLSTAMTLLPGLRQELEDRFGCPVLDIYGMNEAGPIAVASPDGEGYRPLQPRLYIEILDEDEQPCPLGQRGEITLTGGFNSALPLLRYRTGDRAALIRRGTSPVLVGFDGRAPVALEAAPGEAVNTIDVRAALERFPFGRYRLHQNADRSLRVEVDQPDTIEPVDPESIREALTPLFGPVAIEIDRATEGTEGPTFTSDLD